MNIRKTSRVEITGKVGPATVNINYEFTDSAPAVVSMNAQFSQEGGSSNIHRQYRPDKTFAPVPANPIYPFDAAFDTAIAGAITEIFAKHEEPEITTID